MARKQTKIRQKTARESLLRPPPPPPLPVPEPATSLPPIPPEAIPTPEEVRAAERRGRQLPLPPKPRWLTWGEKAVAPAVAGTEFLNVISGGLGEDIARMAAPRRAVQAFERERAQPAARLGGAARTIAAGLGGVSRAFQAVPRAAIGTYARTGLPGSEAAGRFRDVSAVTRRGMLQRMGVPTLGERGIAALRDPAWWSETAGELYGTGKALSAVTGPMGRAIGAPPPPPLTTLRGLPLGAAARTALRGAGRRAIPYAATLGTAGALETAARPESTPREIAAAGLASAAAGGLLSAGMDLARVPLSRLLKKPTTAMTLPPPPSGARPRFEGQRPGETLAEFARRLKREGGIPTDIYRELVGSRLFSGLPVPSGKLTKAMLQRAAKPIPGLTRAIVNKIYTALGEHGGDVLQAALAVGVSREAAETLASAISKKAANLAIIDELRERAKQKPDHVVTKEGVTAKIHEKGVSRKIISFVRKMVDAAPEFAVDPTFTVNADGEFVFHDGLKWTIRPEMFGLNPGDFKPGERVRIDLKSFGINREQAMKRAEREAEGVYRKGKSRGKRLKGATYKTQEQLNEAFFRWRQGTGEVPQTWQMSQEDYVAERMTHKRFSPDKIVRKRGGLTQFEYEKFLEKEHKAAVREAVKAGKSVPPAVVEPYARKGLAWAKAYLERSAGVGKGAPKAAPSGVEPSPAPAEQAGGAVAETAAEPPPAEPELAAPAPEPSAPPAQKLEDIPLTGSDKQIAWARNIIANTKAWLPDALKASMRSKGIHPDHPRYAEAMAKCDEMAAQIEAALASKTRASWWIDHRAYDPEQPLYLGRRLNRLDLSACLTTAKTAATTEKSKSVAEKPEVVVEKPAAVVEKPKAVEKPAKITKKTVQVGDVYAVKVSGKTTPVRIDRENPRGGWDATNLRTKRKVRIRTARRLRKLLQPAAAKAPEPTPQPAPKPVEEAKPSAIAATEADRRAAKDMLEMKRALGGEQPPKKPPEAPPAAQPAPEKKRPVKVTKAELKVARREARRALARLKALRARQAEHAETLKAFKAVIKKLPMPLRGKVFSGRWPETPGAYLKAMEQADKYLVRFLKDKPIKRLQKARKWLKKHRLEMEPDVRAEADELLKLIGTKKRPLLAMDLDALDDLADRADEAVFRQKSEQALVASQRHTNRLVAAKALLTEMHASSPVTPEEHQARTRELSALRRLGRSTVVKTNTLAERYMGGEDSVAAYYFIDQVDSAHRRYAEMVVAAEDNVAKAAEKCPGGSIDSEEFYQWWNEPLTLTFPTLGKKTATRGAWLGLWLNLSDPDTEAEMVAEKWAGFVWKKAREGPKFRPVMADIDAFRAYMAEHEAVAIDFGLVLKDFKNNDDYFDPISETHKRLDGTYLERVEDRWGRKRNVSLEKQQEPPDLSSPDALPIIGEAGRYKRRTGSRASIIICDPLEQYFEETYGDAAYVAYAPVVYDAWKLLGTNVEGLTVAGHIDATLGKPTARIFFDHLRHIMATRTMQPAAEPDELTAKLLRNAVRAALTGRAKPIIMQVPSALAPAADTKPLGIGRLLSGMYHAWLGGEFKALRDDLMNRAAEFAYRWKYRSALSIVSPGYVPTHTFGRRKMWRRLMRLSAKGMEGMRWADSRAITAIYAAHIEDQLKAAGIRAPKGKLLDTVRRLENGDAILNRAADATSRHTNRTQPPNSPAHDTGMGRLSRTSALWSVFTRFMSQRIQYLNMVLRSHAAAVRTGDYRPFLWSLSVLAFLSAIYTLIGVGARALRGKPPKSAGAVGLDYVENVAGNIYFGGELVHLLRARSSYEAGLRGNIAVTTLENTGKALVDLRQAIFDGPKRGKAVMRAAANLTRGLGGLLGLPALAVLNTTEIVAAPFRREKKTRGKTDERRTVQRAAEGNVAAARKLRDAGMTLVRARALLRDILRDKPTAERVAALRTLTKTWGAAGRAAA